MKKNQIIIISLLLSLTLANCTKADKVDSKLEVQNFVWKGLNAYYLWQDEIDNLQDNRFKNQEDLNNFISNKTADGLFESLLYERGITDKWSWIVEDYLALEQLFAGVRKTNGMKFGVVAYSENSQEVFGYVQYVLPNSEAANLGIHRGDIIYGINGTALTRANYISLLSTDNYTINFGNILQSTSTISIIPNNVNISLTKEILNENPIHIVATHEISGRKIGYIFYNQFVSNYDSQLNDAFLQLKNENITDLVLDLRYNGGGSVQTAVNLASMITGQFTNKLFAKERWNTKWQSYLSAEHPDYLINNFTSRLSNGESINSLNLNEVTIIVTGRSASASELVINGLIPYINVNLVGTTSHGKYVGSVTLYDSDSYRKDDKSLNENHHYAMQPIVLEMVNKLGNNNKQGFIPENYLTEDFTNLSQLGNPEEPLFELAINAILGLRKVSAKKQVASSKIISDSNLGNPFYENMFVDFK